jgi:hypothetical protein
VRLKLINKLLLDLFFLCRQQQQKHLFYFCVAAAGTEMGVAIAKVNAPSTCYFYGKIMKEI